MKPLNVDSQVGMYVLHLDKFFKKLSLKFCHFPFGKVFYWRPRVVPNVYMACKNPKYPIQPSVCLVKPITKFWIIHLFLSWSLNESFWNLNVKQYSVTFNFHSHITKDTWSRMRSLRFWMRWLNFVHIKHNQCEFHSTINRKINCYSR